MFSLGEIPAPLPFLHCKKLHLENLNPILSGVQIEFSLAVSSNWDF